MNENEKQDCKDALNECLELSELLTEYMKILIELYQRMTAAYNRNIESISELIDKLKYGV